MFNAALFREPKAREDHPTLMFNAKKGNSVNRFN
jgi:hypothetical protein